MHKTVVTSGGCVGCGDTNDPFFKAFMEALSRDHEPQEEEPEEHIKFELSKKAKDSKDLDAILAEFNEWVESESGWWYLLYCEDDEDEDGYLISTEGQAILDKFIKDLSEIFPGKKFKTTKLRHVADDQAVAFDLVIADQDDIKIIPFETEY